MVDLRSKRRCYSDCLVRRLAASESEFDTGSAQMYSDLLELVLRARMECAAHRSTLITQSMSAKTGLTFVQFGRVPARAGYHSASNVQSFDSMRDRDERIFT